jgi:hypothetical protein
MSDTNEASVQSIVRHPEITVYAQTKYVDIDGFRYEWCGGMGSVLTSFEIFTKQGDLRRIGNVVFIAKEVQRGWIWSEVWWIPDRDFDYEFVRRFRKALFW